MAIEAKHIVKVYPLDKPMRVSKELQNELKGAAGGKRLARMKKEGVSCPVLEKDIGFVQCFACSNFIRRVTGDVHCLGEPLT